MSKDKRTLAIAAAIWQAFCFVLMSVWIRMMGESFTTFQQVFWRFVIAAILCWLLFGRKFNAQIFRELKAKDWMVYFIRATLNYAVGVFLLTVAVLNIDIAAVSFIASLPLAGLLAWIMFGEKLAPKAIWFILLSVVGLAMLTGIGPSNLRLSPGAIATLVGSIGFSASYLMVRYHHKNLSNFHNTTLTLSFAWIIPLVLLLLSHQPIIPHSINTVAAIGLAASVALNITGLYFISFIFANLKAYVAGNILLLEGVFAIPVGYILYRESLNSVELAGAAVIIFCAIALSRLDHKQEKALEGGV